MAFTNLFEAIYPVGSIYLSTSSTSPSTLIGGTWVQIKGAMLGITGGNGVVGAASYGGNLAMTEAQMPKHFHSAWSSEGSDYYFTLAKSWNTDSIGRVSVASGSNYTVMGANKNASDYGGISDISQGSGTDYTGSSQNFLPYHFGVYGWYRTA